ncbi:MAG: class I SAM-dependent methyltransferase [Methanomassiliicoccales archaeon]|nr:class I SAM-dependent methyltransferase [Methanomassiliicoccales archaeon]
MSNDRLNKMDLIRKHFSSQSDDYDQDIIKCIPSYITMLAAVVGSLPFDESEVLHIIDLGTGTGALSNRVMQRFPNCKLTCVDMTCEMLEKAKLRLVDSADITYLEKDFYDLELQEGCDAVVSSLALHHLMTNDDKRSFYAKVYRSLRPGGVFVNADAVLSTDEWIEDLYMRKWVEFMRVSMDEDEVKTLLERCRREDSFPCLMDQLRWLIDAGFSKVDVIWKDHMSAVVWARR